MWAAIKDWDEIRRRHPDIEERLRAERPRWS